MKTFLHVGGLVAAGFDATGAYLLTVSHSGRGVFSTATWQRVARDTNVIYPEGGSIMGIGPIMGQKIPLTEKDFSKETLCLKSPDAKITLAYDDGVISVEVIDA